MTLFYRGIAMCGATGRQGVQSGLVAAGFWRLSSVFDVSSFVLTPLMMYENHIGAGS